MTDVPQHLTHAARRQRWKLVVNLVLFQVAWFACVLSAARGQSLTGVLVVAVDVGIQWGLSTAPAVDIALTGLAVLLGLVWDTAMARFGVVVYASPEPFAGFAPAWILALWALLATVLREPLRWLHGRPVLAALVGAVSGPASYAGAVRLGAGSFPQERLAWVVLAGGWAVMTPMLTEAARRLGARRSARRQGAEAPSAD